MGKIDELLYFHRCKLFSENITQRLKTAIVKKDMVCPIYWHLVFFSKKAPKYN